MPVAWTVKQFGRIVEDFREQCDEGTWKAVLLALSFLKAKGSMAGPNVAKTLTDADGIWELLAGHRHHEPRLLFYFDADVRGLMIFVHAFMKTGGKKDYKPATALAQKRRALIRQGKATTHDIDISRVH
jgi:hypothetical protein